MKVILINGAPRSGKDTVANIMQPLIQSIVYSQHPDAIVSIAPVKEQLVRLTRRFFDVLYIDWADRYVEDKDTPWDKLNGMSQREALIWLSEEVVKPKFGNNFFGKKFKENWCKVEGETENDVLIVPDSGFIEEAETIIEYYGKENCVMINTFREGTDFSKDSRSLITGSMLGIKGYEVHNNSDISDLEISVPGLVNTILEYFYGTSLERSDP